MTSIRTDREVLDIALKMGLVKRESTEEIRQRLDAGGTLTDEVWRVAGLSDEDREHLAYVATRVNTVMEGGAKGGDPHATKAGLPLPSGQRLNLAVQPEPPRHVGRYRIESMHAAGGMGRVWRAFDEILQRSVALKDVRPDVLQSEVRRRFLDEARITAKLEHPGIIPVYDMPASDDAPSYVMRFVRGKTLAKAIGEYHQARRQNGAAPAEFFRLVQVFHSVCQTVAYAHARNVLHRDLKPANVLLGDFGEVLVLDWGLAKGEPAVSATVVPPDQTLGETQVGQVIGTPTHMSPEQSRGEVKALTTRTDVWSLGVILYELLAGQVPFLGDNLNDTLRKLRDESPCTPRSFNSQAPRGLEAICLKSLAKDAAGRYASAQELADEIARWLADEPVHAYVEPWWQRLARWGRRHKVIVAAACAIAVSAVIALSLSTFFINQQRSRAESNLRTALDVVDSFFVSVSENRLLNEPGMQPLRAELLRSAIGFAEKFAAENASDSNRKVDLARMMLLLGRVLSQLDEPQQSLAALEKARAMYAKLRQARPNDFEPLRGEALATLSLGLRHHQSDPERAEREYRDAIAQYARLKDEAPELKEAREKLALALSNLGTLTINQGKLDDAQEQFERAIGVMEELVRISPDNVTYPDELAGCHSNLADVWMRKKNLAETRRHIEASVALRRDLVAKGVKGIQFEESLAESNNHLGNLATMEQKWADAEARFREALGLRQATARRNPDVPRLKAKLAWAHYALSKALERQSLYAEAIGEIGTAIEILKLLANEAPRDAVAQAELGRAYLYQGYYLYDAKNLSAADHAFTSALDRMTKLGPALPKTATVDFLNAYWTRAMVRADQGRFDESVADYNRALEVDSGVHRDALTKERDAVIHKANKARDAK